MILIKLFQTPTLTLSMRSQLRMWMISSFLILPTWSRHLEVEAGSNTTLSWEGDTSMGCRFVITGEVNQDTVTCCYSSKLRGDTMCDPLNQWSHCRKEDSFMVEELVTKTIYDEGEVFIGHCVLHLKVWIISFQTHH